MTKGRILVVDDEESLRVPLYTAFQAQEYDTHVAAGGEEALEILEGGDFDAMLTDLVMPDMNGIDLMRHALARFPDLLVILMTGYGTIETAIEALKAGAYDYILKPFKLGEILHVVNRGLEQKRLQKENVELNEINRRLTEIDQIKSNLLRAISHEFRTPLTVIYGWVDLLFADSSFGLSSYHSEGLQAIRESSLRLGRMISNLLEYVGLEKSPARLNRERVDLRPIVEETVKQLAQEMREKELTLARALPSDLPPVPADREKMRILLFNLMENAVKFNEHGGSVVVEGGSNPCQDELWLRITNTLGEIPQDRLAELMKPFTQGDMGITRSASGLGLGLAVAKGIVDVHQGNLHIESEEGKGTSLEIRLPLSHLL